VIAALELDRRLARAGHAVCYLGVQVPLAALSLLAVVGLVLGAALSMVGIGLPLLLGAAALSRWLIRLDRRAANAFLGTQIPPVPAGPATSGGPWRRSLDILSDRALWRIAAVLATKPLLIAVLLAVGLAPVALLAAILQLAVQGLAGVGGTDYLGPWSLGPGLGLALVVLALPAAVLAVATLDALFTLLCTITRALLAPRFPPGGPVREMLAESLGDRTVSIAYWLPDRGAFVDETGRPVALPEPGAERAWTAVERDGRPVAAIVHDAALDTTSELVQAAVAASSLAIDNERLKADLRARLEELRVSRLRIVEATDAARRRIERDLHDGAQQELVSLSLELGLLRARLKDPEAAAPIVDRLSKRLDTALAELRELARGIHPVILTEQGLADALAALAARVPLEVDCDVALDERLPAPVEAAAYFLVAEALTNVVRHAQASRARVEVRRDGEEIVVSISDDGVGGADIGAGSGLRGLEDRLSAVDGVLTVESPVGSGTRLEARIPVAARAPAPGEVQA
jgi:signal transduction histidine kinase